MLTIETPEILRTMRDLVALALKPLDALHLSCAIVLQCDYFLTVDRRLLNKKSVVRAIAVTNPIDFIMQQEE